MLAGGGQNTSGTIRTYAESSLPWYFDLSELSVRHPTQIPTLSGWESLGTQKCVGPKNATYSCSGRSMMPVASSSHHRTPTFDLHAVRSRVYKSCAEMDSRREFRVGISPKTKWYRLEEVVCTWITCTWRLNLLLHILRERFHLSLILLARYCGVLLIAPSYADEETTYHSYVFARCCQQGNHQIKKTTTACTCVRAIPLMPLGIFRASVSWLWKMNAIGSLSTSLHTAC